MSEDHRRHPRIPTQQPVWVEGQDVRVSAEARNMSKGGMFVVSEGDGEAPAIGTTLQIKFEDPHEGQVEVQMEVVWRNADGAAPGLGLRALGNQGMAAFERVVSRYESSAKVHKSTPRTPSKPTSDE